MKTAAEKDEEKMIKKHFADLFRELMLSEENDFERIFAVHPEMKSPRILKALLRICEQYDAPESIWCKWFEFLKVKAGAAGSPKA